MNLPDPNAAQTWSIAPHPFAPTFPEAPGIAHEPDDMTPAQYERQRILRARAFNPAFEAHERKRRGRKPLQ